MSAISDFAAKQTAFNTELASDLTSIKASIDALNAQIQALQNSSGSVTAEDQALIDDLAGKGAALVAAGRCAGRQDAADPADRLSFSTERAFCPSTRATADSRSVERPGGFVLRARFQSGRPVVRFRAMWTANPELSARSHRNHPEGGDARGGGPKRPVRTPVRPSPRTPPRRPPLPR